MKFAYLFVRGGHDARLGAKEGRSEPMKIAVFATAVALITIGGLRAQYSLDKYPPPLNTDDSIVIYLPHPVLAGRSVLPPGSYEAGLIDIAGADLPVLRIRRIDDPKVNIAVTVAPAFRDFGPATNEVTFYHVGNTYYFKTIWVQGLNYGYSFRLPKRVRHPAG
jgi:hypothetical protein